MTVLTSKDNLRVRHWRKLSEDSRYRRTQKRALIEGPHLLAAALQHGHKLVALLATEEGAADAEIGRLIGKSGLRPVLLAESAFRRIVDAENPPGVAAEIAIPDGARQAAGHAIFLERIQDPANVGAIMRSAAAFGVAGVVLDRHCADAWSPKALRAGMGGHFALQIREAIDLGTEIEAFKGSVVCAVPRGGVALAEASLNGSLGWIFGGEGRGVTPAVASRAALQVTIPMASGTESLNVAAAVAICLYEASRRIGL
jgi:TrmH family RNA methyltransferase